MSQESQGEERSVVDEIERAKHYTTDEVASLFGLSNNLLRGWRHRRRRRGEKVGPVFVQFGNSPRYPGSELIRWYRDCLSKAAGLKAQQAADDEAARSRLSKGASCE